MVKRVVWPVVGVAGVLMALLAAAGCGGALGLNFPGPGGFILRPWDGGWQGLGRLRFVDPLGAPVDMPASHSLILFGTDTLAVGTDAFARFQADGLPGSPLQFSCYAPGFLPLTQTLGAGELTLQENTLTLVQSPPGAVAPQILNRVLDAAADGSLHLTGHLSPGASLVAFFAAGGSLQSLEAVSGAPLVTNVVDGPGGTRSFDVHLPNTLTSGQRLFLGAWDDDGFDFVGMYACTLRKTTSNHVPRSADVSETITDSIGAPANGASVLVFEDGAPLNRVAGTTDAAGAFSVTLPAAPTGTITILVEWAGPPRTVCAFRFLP